MADEERLAIERRAECIRDMSRRKQAKPRSLKRDDEQGKGEENWEMDDEEDKEKNDEKLAVELGGISRQQQCAMTMRALGGEDEESRTTRCSVDEEDRAALLQSGRKRHLMARSSISNTTCSNLSCNSSNSFSSSSSTCSSSSSSSSSTCTSSVFRTASSSSVSLPASPSSTRILDLTGAPYRRRHSRRHRHNRQRRRRPRQRLRFRPSRLLQRPGSLDSGGELLDGGDSSSSSSDVQQQEQHSRRTRRRRLKIVKNSLSNKGGEGEAADEEYDKEDKEGETSCSQGTLASSLPCSSEVPNLEEDLGPATMTTKQQQQQQQQQVLTTAAATPLRTPAVATPKVTGVATAAAPYPCQFCERTFPRLSYLKKHEQSHGDEMPYRCGWCARLFKHKRSRDRHVKLHTGDRRYRCSHCEAAFSRSDHLKIHIKTHDTQKPYQCSWCTRGYNTAAALTSHMQSHKKPKQYEMDEKDDRRRQQQDVSENGTATTSSPRPPLTPTINLLPPPPPPMTTTTTINKLLKLACMYCTRDSFTSMRQLQLHVRGMHETARGNDDVEQKIEQQQQPPSEQLLSCAQCTIKLPSLSSLRDHLLFTHHRPGLPPAPQATVLLNKESNKEEDEQQHTVTCPLCGLACASATVYAEHYVLKHCEEPQTFAASSTTSATWPAGAAGGTKGKRRGRKSSDEEENDDNTEEDQEEEEEEEEEDKRCVKEGSVYSAGTLLCGQCDAVLEDFESFRQHLAGHLVLADRRRSWSNSLPQASRHRCPECGASFREHASMLAHLTRCHYMMATNISDVQPQEQYACTACLPERRYPRAEQLQVHLLEAHAERLFRCALCRDTFDSLVAIQVHFAVKHCSKKTWNNAKSSREEWCRPVATGFKCIGPSCGALLASEAELRRHVERVHLRAPSPSCCADGRHPSSPPPRTTPCLSSSPLAAAGSNYRCAVCHEDFHVELLLERHLALAHRPVRPSSSGSAGGSSRKRARPASNNNSPSQRDHNRQQQHQDNEVGSQAESGGRHKCNICDELTSTAASLAEHKLQRHCKIQLGDTCVVCRCSLGNEADFLRHLQAHSSSSSSSSSHLEASTSPPPPPPHLPAPCVVCRQTLVSELECRMHAKHHLQRPQLVLQGLLLPPPNPQQLERQQSEPKTQLCGSCHAHRGEAYSSARGAVRTRTDISRARRCSECGVKLEDDTKQEDSELLGFKDEEDHQLVQDSAVVAASKQLRCHLCPHDAASAMQLQAHLIEHTFAGCTALACYICQALFTAPLGLQNHMLREHGLGARPYDCSHCACNFFFRTELDHHFLTFHHLQQQQQQQQQQQLRSSSQVNDNAENKHVDEMKPVMIKSELHPRGYCTDMKQADAIELEQTTGQSCPA